MPSKSKSQHKLMETAAHTKGGYDGVPQKVGKDFVAADKSDGKFQGKKRDGVKSAVKSAVKWLKHI